MIHEEGDLAFVKIETSSQSYEKKEIELGLSDGIYVEVKTGLGTLTNIKKRTDPQANTAESD